jgi:hypothetical protein
MKQGHSIAQLKELLKETIDTAKLLGEAQSSFRVLLNVMGCEAPVTLSSASFLLETVRIVEKAPFERLHLRQPASIGRFRDYNVGRTLLRSRGGAAWHSAFTLTITDMRSSCGCIRNRGS